MVVILTKIGKTPGQTQFGLDTFTEHYKCDATADIVLTDASVPQKGDAHSVYGHMYLTDRHCRETGESASALDLTYQGSLSTGPDPVLPPAVHRQSNPIQSTTSSAQLGLTATTQATIEYYAVVNHLQWFSHLGPGALNTVANPTGQPVVRSFISNDIAYSPETIGFQQAVLSFFSLSQTDTLDSTEIIAGKYWLNNETKTLYYGPLLSVVVCSGSKCISIYIAGSGYVAGDTLTCTDGATSAVLSITAVGGGGSITGFSIVSDTISASIFLAISATGGSGSGAWFRFYGA